MFYEQDDQGDSFSAMDIPPLANSDEDDNFSIGNTPLSKAKKIHHSIY